MSRFVIAGSPVATSVLQELCAIGSSRSSSQRGRSLGMFDFHQSHCLCGDRFGRSGKGNNRGKVTPALL
jgi:hypothetical protein